MFFLYQFFQINPLWCTIIQKTKQNRKSKKLIKLINSIYDIIHKRQNMALKTIATLLEDNQNAIDKVLTSQEYEIANRRQRMAMLEHLSDREKQLVKMGEKKGFDSTLAGDSGKGAFHVQFG